MNDLISPRTGTPLDFPGSPTVGQQFVSAGMIWQWDGVKWVAINNAVNIIASTTPPSSPNPGDLWWDANGGQLYLWYNDGNSAQWVVANTAAGTPSWQVGTGLVLNPSTPPTIAVATPYVPVTGRATKMQAFTNPTGTTSTTGVMAGLAFTVTPGVTGVILVEFWGIMYSSASSNVSVNMRYGTGAAPANGAALAGNVITTNNITALVNVQYTPFHVSGILSGLTVGTTYWFDLQQWGSNGTMYLYNVNGVAAEI
jgi:hypothetical protein